MARSGFVRPLAVASLALLGMQCDPGKGAVENATDATLHLAVFYMDGEYWEGDLESGSEVWYSRAAHQDRVDRIEVRRPDGSVHRLDRARLDLLSAGIAKPEEVYWRIEPDGVRALTEEAWRPLQEER